MKIVPFYVTDDGKKFADKTDARKHEVETEALEKLRFLLKASIDSSLTKPGNADNVLRNILMESQEVRNILLSYSKKYPREQVEEVAKAA